MATLKQTRTKLKGMNNLVICAIGYSTTEKGDHFGLYMQPNEENTDGVIHVKFDKNEAERLQTVLNKYLEKISIKNI